jgi:integrase
VSAQGLPPGVRRRHARSCPALATDDLASCRCRPSYQAQAGPRRSRQTRTFQTLAAAKGWKRDVERAWEKGELATQRAPRLRVAAEDWLAKAEAGIVLARGDKPYRASTLRGYRHWMNRELYGPLADHRLDQITRGGLNALVQGLQARGLAAQTVKNVVMPLRAVYRHAMDLEQVTVNPTLGIRVPAGSGRRMRFVEPSAIGSLLGALPEGDRALWATAIYAGLRRGELQALAWRDVDLASGVITVRRSYDVPSGTTGEVKSAAGQDRRVVVCAALREMLLEHRHCRVRDEELVERRIRTRHRSTRLIVCRWTRGRRFGGPWRLSSRRLSTWARSSGMSRRQCTCGLGRSRGRWTRMRGV